LILAGFLASAGASEQAPAVQDRPVEVEVSLVLIDLSGVDDTLQQFSANIFIRMVWTDRTRVRDFPDSRTLPLDEVWNPRLEITNEILLRETLPRNVEVTSDGQVTYYQRLVGSVAQTMDLREFPFDRQSFLIRFAAVGFRPGDIEWVVSRETAAMLAENWSVSNWKLIDWNISDQPFSPAPGLPTIPGIELTMNMERGSAYFIFKVILPLILIVAMSWIVFWISPELMSSQISVAVTSMLTLIAYRFMVDGLVPRVSYFTRLDLFIMGGTLLVFLTLIIAVWTGVLARTERSESADRIDLVCRIAFPVLSVAVTLGTLLF
jgi:hypothetical protein